MPDLNIDIENITQPISVDVDFKCETNNDVIADLNTNLTGFVDKTTPINLKLSDIETLPATCLNNTSNLVSVDFPNVTQTGVTALSDCRSLVFVNLPKLTQVNVNAFNNDPALKAIVFPEVTTVNGGAFRNCETLKLLDFYKVTTIRTSFCNYSFNFNTLIIRTPQVCEFDAPTNVLQATAFDIGDGGTIYVPANLVTRYERTLITILRMNPGNQILPIEGSIYERSDA